MTGAVYDILPPRYVISKPIGEFNHSRIVVSGNNIEHWLNGIKTLKYELNTDIWSQNFNNSLFRENSNFGKSQSGHIAIANQEGQLWLKNIRVRNF